MKQFFRRIITFVLVMALSVSMTSVIQAAENDSKIEFALNEIGSITEQKNEAKFQISILESNKKAGTLGFKYTVTQISEKGAEVDGIDVTSSFKHPEETANWIEVGIENGSIDNLSLLESNEFMYMDMNMNPSNPSGKIDIVESPTVAFTLTLQADVESMLTGWYRFRITPATSRDDGSSLLGYHNGRGDSGIFNDNLGLVDGKGGVYTDFLLINENDCGPKITVNPVSQTRTYGDSTTVWDALSVTAVNRTELNEFGPVVKTDEPTYRWYVTTDDPEVKPNPQWQTIDGATSNTYTPANDLEVGGKRWYRCEATSKLESGGTASTMSLAALNHYMKGTLPGSVWTISGADGQPIAPTDGKVPYTGEDYTLTHTWDGTVQPPEAEYVITHTDKDGNTKTGLTDKRKDVGTYSAELNATENSNYEKLASPRRFDWEIIPGTIEAGNDLTADIPIYATITTAKNISDLINPRVANKSTLKYTVTDDSGKFDISNDGTVNAAIVCKSGVTDYNQVYNVKVHVEDTANNYNPADFTLKMKIMKSSPAEVVVTATVPELTFGDEILDDLRDYITDVQASFDNNGTSVAIPGANKDQCQIISIKATNPANDGVIKNADTYTVTVGWEEDYESKSYYGEGKFQIVVNRANVGEPTVTESFVYNGEERTPLGETAGLEIISGEKATNVDDYTVTVEPDGNHQWADGTFSPKTYNWKITPITGSGVDTCEVSKNEEVTYDPKEIENTLGGNKTFGDILSIDSNIPESGVVGGGPLSVKPTVSADKKITFKGREDIADGQSAVYTLELKTTNYSKYTLELTVKARPRIKAYFKEEDFADASFPYQGDGLAETIKSSFKPVPEKPAGGEAEVGTGAKREYTYYSDAAGTNEINESDVRNARDYYVSVKYTDNVYEADQTVKETKLKKITVTPATGLNVKNEGEIVFAPRAYDGTTDVAVANAKGTVTFGGLLGTDSVSSYTISSAVADGAGVGERKVTYHVTLNDPKIEANYIVEELTGTNGKLTISACVIPDENVKVSVPDKIYTIGDDTKLTIPVNTAQISTSVATENPLPAGKYSAYLTTNGQTATIDVELNDKNYTFADGAIWKSKEIPLVKDENVTTNAISGVYYGDTLPAPTAKIFGTDATGGWYNGKEVASSSTNQALAVFTTDGGTVYALVSVSASNRPTDKDDDYDYDYDDDDDDDDDDTGSTPDESSGSSGRPLGRPGSSATKHSGSNNAGSGKPLTPPNGAATNPPAPGIPPVQPVQPEQGEKVFTDTTDHWSSEAVSFVTERELFQGTSEDEFSPDVAMNRAMLVTVLARLDGADTTGGATWYEAGINWAKENGVSDGKNPLNNVTRQELATMLWRYASKPAASGNLTAFTDANGVSDWALEAMRWATENGIITGKGKGVLAPTAQATRAEVAMMIMRFVKLTEA